MLKLVLKLLLISITCSSLAIFTNSSYSLTPFVSTTQGISCLNNALILFSLTEV